MRLIDGNTVSLFLVEKGQRDIKKFKLGELIKYTPSEVGELIKEMPTIDPVVRCKDCKWWDKREESNYGYCHAAKHGYYSRNWEISIYRTYSEDFFCADGERKGEEDERSKKREAICRP